MYVRFKNNPEANSLALITQVKKYQISKALGLMLVSHDCCNKLS